MATRIRWLRASRTVAPGLLLCLAVSGVAAVGEWTEHALTGAVWVDGLVLAIALGSIVRTCWLCGPRWQPGIHVAAKQALEIAVVLLGASVDAKRVMAAGLPLLVGIALLVALALGCGYALGRLFGLHRRMAVLVACGNAICGNSAIAAIAPIIEAEGRDVSAAIAFTAVLGIGLVLVLPPLDRLLGLGSPQSAILAGLTVYAVPQVFAATAPLGPAASQLGMLVKLTRVLMLGPVAALAGLIARRAGASTPDAATVRRPALLPWFVAGFLVVAALRAAGVIPPVLLRPVAGLSGLLTMVAMAALGLSTDLRGAVQAGGRVACTAALSLLALAGLALAVIRLLGPG